MNQKIKYLGLLAILPMLTLALSPDYIGTAEAGTSSVAHKIGLPQPAESFESYKGEPFVEVVSVTEFSAKSPDKYKVAIKAHSGNADISNLQILVESDIRSDIIEITGISAGSTSIANVLLVAFDPASVTVEILDWTLNE